jgi:hypothetical protein
MWSVAVATLAALGIAAGFLMTLNPTNDKDALLHGRTKPGSSVAASKPDPAHYGMARGTPIIHTDGNNMVDPRQKPMGR